MAPPQSPPPTASKDVPEREFKMIRAPGTNPALRWIPKKEREQMAVEQKAEEARLEAARAIQQAAEDREWRISYKRESKPTPAEKKTGEKRPADLIEEKKERERYFGPEVNQTSRFSAAKKRQRREREKFRFGWDDSEDTTPQWMIEQASNPLNRPRFDELAGYDEVWEKHYRARADHAIKSDPVGGEQCASALMQDFYSLRDRWNKENERRGLKRKHYSKKTVDEMTERDWRIFKEDYGISIRGSSLPNPMRSWHESGLPSRLLQIVANAGYDEPTPIQKAAIPIALKARDLIGVAVTGSGKTVAFLLPMLTYILDLPALEEFNKNYGPYALIIAPTRELVQQIEAEARKFAGPLGFNVVSLVGGHAIQEQSMALQKGAEIIVATPGRLVDCIESRLLVLSQCCYLVMDEADRMIDLGFEESVTKILAALPDSNVKPDTDDDDDDSPPSSSPQLIQRSLGIHGKYRQTMMYTATMSPLLERIAKNYLRRPVTVTIGNDGQAVESVEQRVEFVSGEDKRKKRLQEIFGSGEFTPPIIVFVNIRRNCDAVARDIKAMGFSVATMHGGKSQDQREASLLSVRNGQASVLVATDLAGRGIDVLDVSLVINFNMALTIESYTHRIGRTGRAGKSGVAITFLGNEDSDVLYDLRQILSKSSISRVPDELKRHEAAQQKPGKAGKKALMH